MASLGAKVLQMRSVELGHGSQRADLRALELRQAGRHRSAWDPPGTLICDEEEIVEKQIVTGIAFSKDEAKITLRRVADKPGVAAAIFGPLAEANINVDMIVQNVSADGATTDLTFTVPAADYERAADVLAKARKAIGYERLDGATDVAKVSVIGVGMRSHAGVAAKAFKALAEKGDQHPGDHHLGDQVLAADRRRLHRAGGAHAAPALRAGQGVAAPSTAA